MERPRLKIRRDQVPIVQAYSETFGTDAGKIVLEDLEKSFGGECHVRGDHYETLHRSSQRDIIERIKYLIGLSGLEVEEEDEENA